MNAVEAGQALVEERFPNCLAAFLAGSVMRNEGTRTSDLDIVIVTANPEAPYRESIRAFGWPVELFVHTTISYRRFFVSDCERRRPSLVAMCAEGAILRNKDELAQHIKQEARALLKTGPEPLSPDEVKNRRYGLTDLLDDLAGSDREEERIFIAHDVAAGAANLILLHHHQWIGSGKWTIRALRRYDTGLATELGVALLAYCRRGDATALIRFADGALDLVGGRLRDGFYSPGPRDDESS